MSTCIEPGAAQQVPVAHKVFFGDSHFQQKMVYQGQDLTVNKAVTVARFQSLCFWKIIWCQITVLKVLLLLWPSRTFFVAKMGEDKKDSLNALEIRWFLIFLYPILLSAIAWYLHGRKELHNFKSLFLLYRKHIYDIQGPPCCIAREEDKKSDRCNSLAIHAVCCLLKVKGKKMTNILPRQVQRLMQFLG